MNKTKKKGQMGFNVLLGAAISLVVMVVGVAFGIQILSDQRTTNTSVEEGAAYDAGVTGLAKFPAKTAMLAGIVILVVVIALLLSLTGRGRK